MHSEHERAAAPRGAELLEARRLLASEGELFFDFGDAPDSYGTLLASAGAHHVAAFNVHLGLGVDAEPDGQPSPGADRDDLTGPALDDEDGVLFLSPLLPGHTANIQVINGGLSGLLNAWVDFDFSGTFDPLEQVFTNLGLAGGSVNPLSFPVPINAIPTATYARFRLSQPGSPVGPIGLGGIGEVEDYRVRIDPLDYGDAPNTYGTSLAAGGARHQSTSSLLLGSLVDSEADGQPSAGADRDDLVGIDDEDGVTFSTPIVQGATATVDVVTGAGAGLLSAWIDFDQNGAFDPADQVFADVALAGGVSTSLSFNVPAAAIAAQSYMRFRFSGVAGLGPTGFGGPGEVEDYAVRIEQPAPQLDFGDAPQLAGSPFNYPTTLAGGNPARHTVITFGPRLGSMVDLEPDGQPNLAATGDDIGLLFGGIDDEDGVTVGGVGLETAILTAGTVLPVAVSNGGGMGGRLNAWFDWNRDGDWNDPGEQIATNTFLSPGITIIPVSVPAGLTGNAPVYSRFRVNIAGGLGPGGAAQDGEVEDYRSRVGLDTTPPTVVAGTLQFDQAQAVVIAFDEPMDPATFDPSDLVALNTDDGNMPVATAVVVAAGNQAATWVFSSPGTFVGDGDYQFTLPAGSVTDASGNGLAPGFVLSGPSVFWNSGDADRDRTVDIDDFSILATNFNTVGSFVDGDSDYTGTVDIDDFSILAAKFNTILPAAGVGAGARVVKASVGDGRAVESPFGVVRRIGLTDDDEPTG